MHLLGDAAWWLPRWLDRLLPNVDVEGSALERSHPQAEAAKTSTISPSESSPEEFAKSGVA